MIPVTIVGSKKSKTVFALLDDGSTATVINSKIIEEIGAESQKIRVALKGFGKESAVTLANEKTDITIRSINNKFSLKNILLVDNLSLPVQELSKNIIDMCFKETGIRLNSYRCAPDLLIGQDQSDLIVSLEFREIIKEQLFVSRCSLGWTIHGHYTANNSDTVRRVHLLNKTQSNKRSNMSKRDIDLDNLIRFYFKLESVGVNSSPRVNETEKRALDILERTSRNVDGHWEVGLLWKSDHMTFSDGKTTALQRLNILEKKLSRDENYAKMYETEMQRLFETGFAEIANPHSTFRRRYLPHFDVRNINKPDRLRIVHDAAAKTNSISFNDLMLAGPDLLKSLLGVIMRFRQFAIAIKSDMKDMFMKVKIRKEDRDAQRFFWRIGQAKKLTECVMSSMLFGAKSSPCTALFIKNRNANTFASVYPNAVKSVINNFYMDDYLDSCMTVSEASERVRQVIEINAKADWQMHSWSSNDKSVFVDIQSNNNSNTPLFSVNSKETGGEKILGLIWLNETDELGFNQNTKKIDNKILTGMKKPTKREFLRVIMSIFDPLGLLSPFTIRSRILMRDICLSMIDWDEELRDDEFKKWQIWLRDFESIKTCTIPRCYQIKEKQLESAELHVFCDASDKAYAAVAYWRFTLDNGSYHTPIIAAKSRVAPIEYVSIPRLELQAALLGSKIAKVITEEHNFKIIRRIFWSDSITVLRWIKEIPRTFKIYVANRLGEISENTKSLEWRWVPSADNPADDATKLAPDALKKDSRWLTAPPFLRENESEWPIANFINFNADSETDERELVKATIHVLAVETPVPLIDCLKYSSWRRLISVTSLVFFQIEKMRKRNRTLAECVESAEEYHIKLSQTSCFSTEIDSLKRTNECPRNSRILPLNVFLDDHGVLRVEGRLTNLSKAYYNNLIILDAKHEYTQLLIKPFHRKYYHGSNESVLNELRQKYWIIGLRKALRSIVAKCIVCKWLRAHPSQPKMAALPSARLAYRLMPFSHCGLDYFGPLTIKIGRRKEKRWAALFTCMTTRAIHIELVHTLSSDSAIMALKRFISRRGSPTVIYCDNGTNFRGACNELKQAVKKLKEENLITRFASQKHIE